MTGFISEFETDIGLTHHADEPMVPVHVIVDGDQRDEPIAAQLSSFITFDSSQPGAFRLLSQDEKRKRSIVQVLPADAGMVLVGASAQVQNGQGFTMTPGMQLEIQSAREVWCQGDGVNALLVAVLDERYA